MDVRIEDVSLDPVSVELRVTVRTDLTATELRGKFLGPGCPYSNTIEIAYPLLPPRRGEASEPGTLSARVVIPEASLWDPQSPFVYHGVLELWQDGERREQHMVPHALRKIRVGPNGVRVNNKVFRLEGRVTESLDEKTGRRWHQEGVNLLVVPYCAKTLVMWDKAERLGFLVLGRVVRREEAGAPPGKASHLGFIWGEGVLESDIGIRCEPEESGHRLVLGDQEIGQIRNV